ncbi:MoxR family ATPase [Methylophilaceae bacterium]|jgi:MoxR-like ATPase|nr:MoxR family ATPase [Methylophilaceae bacterium]|tara:strand:+ start:14254 stop:15270 length:1017 start_codon:yes stop_codon:yes gene_type:complete
MSDQNLTEWRKLALTLEGEVNKVIVGQEGPIKLITTSIFARGHVLLEGDVGVGKTTLLKAFARSIGGGYERIEGTIDLMPNDLIYHTYLGEDGKPHVSNGPILKSGEDLSIFFFNEINRARPQVHSLLLRIMAEKTLSAFNNEFKFPHLIVFADRNQVEKEETFEIPSAARDRFMMEIPIAIPQIDKLMTSLVFDTKFHDADKLIEEAKEKVFKFDKLNEVSKNIQENVNATDALKTYSLNLWKATKNPGLYDIKISGIDVNRLIISGASPRGISMMMKCARVNAWMDNRTSVLPEDIHAVFHETIAHRLVFNPVYELRRTEIAKELTQEIIKKVSAP